MKYFKYINTLISTLLLVTSLVMPIIGHSETAVVVHPSNDASFSNKDIQRLFLGKSKTFPGGKTAIPIDQPMESPIRQNFGKSVLGKSYLQVKSYWARAVFTGRGIPPKEVNGDDELKKLVADNPNTIGYIDDSMVDSSVRVVHRF